MKVRNLEFIGFPGYEVDTDGNVWSLNYRRTGERRKMSPGINSRGYLNVILCNNGKSKTWVVHQLVGKAFLDEHDGLDQINHKNEDKTDNRVANLEFCTSYFNSNWGTRNERISKAKKGTHHTEETRKKIGEAHKGKTVKKVNQYTMDGEFIQSFNSITEASENTGVGRTNISHCLTVRHKSAGGFIWRYA